MTAAKQLLVYLPDTRGVQVARFGRGNAKIGANVYTYSRLPGGEWTCPGATPECERFCYAKRVSGPVRDVWATNSADEIPPPLPDDTRLFRLHVSGDFTSVRYIYAWRERLEARPDVTCWVYTRSWRVPDLMPALEALRALPNVQMFASMDISTSELPPRGWRRAWLSGDARIGADGVRSYVCPEETGAKANCEACRYCFDGKRNDVTFLLHTGQPLTV
jgi:hypothetical protein